LAKLYPDRRQLATLVIGTGGHIDRAVVRALPILAVGLRTSNRLRTAARSRS
jgi:hypothetical protein